jgi:hypothetical protein
VNVILKMAITCAKNTQRRTVTDERRQQRMTALFPFQDGESVLLACGKIKVCPVAALLIFLSLAADGEQRRA